MINKSCFYSLPLVLLVPLMLARCSGIGGGEVGNPGNPYSGTGINDASYRDTVARNVQGVEIKLDPGISIKFISAPPSISIPRKPWGDSGAIVGFPALFTTGGSVCSNNQSVEYRFSLQDSDAFVLTLWSRDSVLTHSWTHVGICLISAQARSAVDTSIVSRWSDSLTVRVR